MYHYLIDLVILNYLVYLKMHFLIITCLTGSIACRDSLLASKTKAESYEADRYLSRWESSEAVALALAIGMKYCSVERDWFYKPVAVTYRNLWPKYD